MTKARSNATAEAAKGDLRVGTGTNLSGILSAGNNGESLVLDSSTSTGLRYQAVSAVKPNFAVNGNFDIWQRGTSFTSSGYTADRWYASISGTTTVAQETTIVPDGSTYALKWTTGASSSYAEIYNALEAQDVNALGGKTITVSVKVRAQVSFASTFRLRLQTNTTANTQTGGAWTTVVTTDETPSTSAFTTVSATYTVPVGTKGLRIALQPAAAQASGTGLYLGQAQLEVGSVATAYKYAGGTIQGELAACQRYFQKTNNQREAPGTAPSTTPINALNASSTLVVGVPPFKLSMRVAPTVTLYSSVTGTTGRIRSGGADVVASAADVGEFAIGYISATGLVAGSNSTIAFAASAEL